MNGLAKFGIRYRAHGSGMEVKECGIHLVYKKDIESSKERCNRIRAASQRSNNSIILYEGSDDCDGFSEGDEWYAKLDWGVF